MKKKKRIITVVFALLIISVVVWIIWLIKDLFSLDPPENYYITFSNGVEITVTYFYDPKPREYDSNKLLYDSNKTGWYVSYGRVEEGKLPEKNFARFHNTIGGSYFFWNDNEKSITILTSDFISENYSDSKEINIVRYEKDKDFGYCYAMFQNHSILDFNRLKKENYF